MITFGKGITLSAALNIGGMPTFRIAVPAWGRVTPEAKKQDNVVSRDEIIALFGDRLKAAKQDQLTEAEQAQKLDIVRLRRAMYF